jgi:hypothetical protein
LSAHAIHSCCLRRFAAFRLRFDRAAARCKRRNASTG